jgi:hypothetical protein
MSRKYWLKDHPEARPLGLVYAGHTDPRIAGIEYFEPQTHSSALGTETEADDGGPQPGWYAISVRELRSASMDYSYFLLLKLVASAGYSIYIYHVSVEEANGMRRRLGLGPVARVSACH